LLGKTSIIAPDINIANSTVDSGEILGISENTGTAIESIRLGNLAAGNYFIVVDIGTNTSTANYSLNLSTSRALEADILWRDTDKDQVGYWRFDGTTYRETKVITGIDDNWKVEAIGDLDGDRTEDILWRNKISNNLVVYLMDGTNGTIRQPIAILDPTKSPAQLVQLGQEWQVIGIGDMNGDGKGDIIWRNALAQTAAIWQMNGAQILSMSEPKTTSGAVLKVASEWNLLAVADLNGDRKADLLWQYNSGTVVSWFMDGSVKVGDGVPNAPAGYKLEAVSDFSGDGKADMLWRNGSGAMTLLLSVNQPNPLNPPTYQAGNLNFQGTPVASLAADWQVAGTDDFSGDGKADIVWRNQSSGDLSFWAMNTNPVWSQVAEVKTIAEVKDLSRKPVGAATRPDDVNMIQLAGISDSGISNSDWITNVRAPSFAGVTSAGNTVSLFANDQLIGEKKAEANGTWAIVTTALNDGVYTIEQKVTNAAGGFTRQTLAQTLMIDGTAPDVQITGPIDGVGWGAQIELAGQLRDLDREAQVEYTVKADGTLAFSAVMGATIENPTVPNPSLTKKTIATTKIDLGPATGTQTFKPYEVALKVTDRAGNISTQTYKGMRLNLPDLTDQSVFLSDTLMPELPDDRQILDPNDPNNPNTPDNGNSRWFIGSNGSWGYGTRGSGTGGGWNWNLQGAGSPPPQIPRHIVNPDERIGYLPALRLMLTTARDVLSKHPDTLAKREALRQQLEMLMAVGEVVESNRFYDLLRDSKILKGVFANAYAPGGITKRQAILNGWDFAKALAIETRSTALQMFETNLYVTSLAALKQNGISGVSASDLKGTIDSLAFNYARLSPFEAAKGYGRPLSSNDFLGNLWNNGKDYYSWSSSVYGGGSNYYYTPSLQLGQWSVQDAIADLAKHLKGQTNPLQALRMVDRMIQSATQVRQLHEDGYLGKTPGWYTAHPAYQVPKSIQDADFLQNLAELAFEIARVNPTVTLGANPTSEWVETLWEGGDVLSAAGGLSELFSGFAAEAVAVRRDKMGQAIDYMGRLVRSVRLVNNSSAAETKQGDFLSHLVNLGGAYAALNPYTSTPTELQSFLHTLWQNSNTDTAITKASQELIATLSPGRTIEERKQILKYQRNQLAMLGQVSDLKLISRDPEFLRAVSIVGYTHQLKVQKSSIADTANTFFSKAWQAASNVQLNGTITGLRSAVAQAPDQPSTLTRDSALRTLISLGINKVTPLPTLLPLPTPPPPIIKNPNVIDWITIDKNRPKVASTGLKIGNKKALILAPHAYEFEAKGSPHDLIAFKDYGADEANEIAQILTNEGFEVTIRRNATSTEDNIDIQRDLIQNDFGQYGIVAITSHGSLGLGASQQYQPSDPVVVSTGKTVMVRGVIENSGYIASGELDFWNVGNPSMTLAFTPELIKKRMTNQGNNTLVYVGSCASLFNDSLANAFLGAGASSVFGYTQDVNTLFASAYGLATFNVLATGRSTAEVPGIRDKDPYDRAGARFESRGQRVSII
jgi:Bacterial Ig-like domain/FG-GAP-like repeat